MKAIRFDAAVPRYALGMALGKISQEVLWSGLSCTFMDDVPSPVLPGPDWVKIQTLYGGICGTDMGTINLHTSMYYSPFSSFPFTIGHENVGQVLELGPEVTGEWRIGERVAVDPLLWCTPRGFTDLCEFCQRGEINRCQRVIEGFLAPGLMTGTCKDTGGSWSREFVAHQSQLYSIPDSIGDENAVMLEPFAIGLHAALVSYPADDETVLIVGAGTIGLATLAALRGLGSKARILVLARYDFQVKSAERLGASEVLDTRANDDFEWIAGKTGGTVRHPILGKRVLSGGADLTIECVGSDSAIDDALRFTRDGGRMVLAGMPGVARGIDWTSIFAQELTLIAARNYSNTENWQGRSWKAFELGIYLMDQQIVDLGWMVTHRYRLEHYKTALREANTRGRSGMIKGVFDFRDPA